MAMLEGRNGHSIAIGKPESQAALHEYDQHKLAMHVEEQQILRSTDQIQQVATNHVSLGTNHESSGIFDYYRRSVSDADAGGPPTSGGDISQNQNKSIKQSSIMTNYQH